YYAAQMLDLHAGVFPQRVAEGIMSSDEKPALAAVVDNGSGGVDRQRIGVVYIMNAVFRALAFGEFGRARAGIDGNDTLARSQPLHRQADGGVVQGRDHVDI